MGPPEVVDGSGSGFAREGFELGEGLFDGIEVGGVGRQAPAVLMALRLMALRTPSTLCLGRLSMMTMSPGLKLGTRTGST